MTRVHVRYMVHGAEVERLRAAGLSFRNDVVTGPGGKRTPIEDPSGSVVEPFRPRERGAR